MKLEIWSLGRESESFVAEGVQYYLRKAENFHPVSFHLLTLPGKNRMANPEILKKREAEFLEKTLQPGDYLILLDQKGKLHSSEEWAGQLQLVMNQSPRRVVLLIGGAYGVSDKVRKRAQQQWSLSRLVFPHQLVRLMVSEQIYRALSILRGSPYHHS